MPAAAQERLRAGNERFLKDTPATRTDSARVRALVGGQRPFAAVLTCSDSRVPVEVLFDQGVGDVYVVRTAGNTAGAHELASLAYAVGELGVSLVVVMGHTECGIVRAVLGAPPAPRPELAPLLACIERAKGHAAPGAQEISEELVDLVCHAHVRDVIDAMTERSPTIHERVSAGACVLMGAMYETGTGRVRFFDDLGTGGA